MNQIFLGKDGTLLHDAKVENGSPLPFLNQGVVLDSGFSLRSYFRMLERHPVLQEINVFMRMLMEEYRKSPGSGCVFAGFDCLEFSKTVEMIGFPGKPRMEIYIVFQGVHQNEHLEMRSIRLENLLDMPLRLGPLKHVVFGDKMDAFEFDTIYSLFEFIDGIAWELSFHGTPTECQIRR